MLKVKQERDGQMVPISNTNNFEGRKFNVNCFHPKSFEQLILKAKEVYKKI